MKLSESTVQNIRDVFSEIGAEGSLDDCLNELSALVAQVLRAKGCTIILLTEEETLHAEAADRSGFGFLPGTPARLHCSPQRPAIENAADPKLGGSDMRGVDCMFSTIVLRGKVVGLIQAVPLPHSSFDKDDLDLFSIVTPIITKSVQVIQLQHLLRSRFTQAALATTNDANARNILNGVMQNPNQIARILAKSFYREMLNAGFSFNQIIFAATEMISELSVGLRKHGARRKQRQKLEQDQLERSWEGLQQEAAARSDAVERKIELHAST